MSAETAFRVYISYSRHDRALATRVSHELQRRGFNVFLDTESIEPGESWVEAIARAISASRAFVLILSEAANSSSQISREVSLAINSGVPVVPLQVDHTPLSREMEYFLGRAQRIELDRNRPERGLEKLSHVVGQLVLQKPSKQEKGTFFDLVLRWVLGWFRKGPSREETWELYRTIDRLRAKDVEEVAARGREFRRTVTAFDRELGIIQRVSRYVSQYLTVENVFRKREALNQAMQELSALQTRSVSRPNEAAMAFLDLANDWRRILELERAKVERQTDEARDIPNPFVFGNPVTELNSNVFTGRKDIVKQIEANILGSNQPPTLLLYGERRMGKTSILNQLPQMLGNAFVPVIVDCQNPAIADSLATLLRYFSRAMTNAAASRGISGDGRLDLAPLTAQELQEAPFSRFEAWLDEFDSRLPNDCHTLLCLDEFERLRLTIEAGWGGRLLDAIRHWLQHRRRLVIMFTGTHTFQELGPEWTDRFISIRRIRVSFLDRSDVIRLLTKPMPSFPMSYENGVVDKIFELTGGQPFLTQAVASEVVQRLNRDHRKKATLADAEAAVEAAIESGGEYFADLWNKLSREERAVLQNAASKQTSSKSSEDMRRLRDRDLLDENNEFAVPMLKRWMMQNHPP
jgi:hypothetical protein